MVLRYQICLTTAALLASVTSAALGETCTNGFARLALHVAPPDSEIACWSQRTCASPIVTNGDLNQRYNVYLVLMDWRWEEQGISELQISVDYDSTIGSGVDVLDFQTCVPLTTTPIGEWPLPGSELRITFPSCFSLDEMPEDSYVIGWFRVIAHTSGTLSLVSGLWRGEPPTTVPRIVTCDLVEKVLDPVNQGAISLGAYGYHPPCGAIYETFPGPCCLPGNSCEENLSPGCCWAQGGRSLSYFLSCTQCFAPLVRKTWGQLKSRYE